MLCSMVSYGSRLNTLIDAHFVLGGLVFGLLGALLVRVSGQGQGWRLAWIPGGKYASTLLLLFPLSIGFERFLPHLLGSDPLGRLPWVLVAFGVLLALLSTVAEWPFFHRAMGAGSMTRSLKLSMRANAVTTILLVAYYLPGCELGLLTTAASRAPESAQDLRVFYLRGDGLYQSGPKLPETCLVSGLSFGPDARLFARRGEQGWDLWLQDEAPAPRRILAKVAPATSVIPQQPAVHVQLKKAFRTGEPTLSQAFGKPADALLETEAAWSLRVGQWPWEGLEVASRDLKGAYRVAQDTPLVSWEVRCATRLPGEQVLYQMGPYLWLLDLEIRQLRFFARGQGAVALCPGEAERTTDPGNPEQQR